MKNKFIVFGAFLVFASIFLCGCQQKGNDNKSVPSPDASKPNTDNQNSSDLNVESIEIAFISENNKPKEFSVLPSFAKANYGPYKVQDGAETAYIALRLTVDQSTSDKNYSVSVENISAYLDKVDFTRGGGAGARIAKARIALAKGKNDLKITVASSDKKATKTYEVSVNYEGGEDFFKPEGDAPKYLIPGIYCPAQRKAKDGEKESYLWVVFIGGKCTSCPLVLNGVGINKFDTATSNWIENEGEDLTRKFKSKGLRVVVIEDGGSQVFHDDVAALKKWNASGRGYNMYTSQHNCLYGYRRGLTALPCMHFIQDGAEKGSTTDANFSSCLPLLKQYFGLE